MATIAELIIEFGGPSSPTRLATASAAMKSGWAFISGIEDGASCKIGCTAAAGGGGADGADGCSFGNWPLVAATQSAVR